MENTSGGGRKAVVPPEIDKWNWGAFFLTWIWGAANNTPIAFLMFVPIVNIPMWVILGIKGSAWAWQNKRWESVEAFKRTQRKWAMWGPVVLVALVLAVGGLFWSVISIMKSSDAYKLAVSEVQASTEVSQLLGTPITPGIPTGSIQVSGADGRANLAFNVEGPKGKGTVYVLAVEAVGKWRLDKAVFEDGATKNRIDLNAQGAGEQ
ncbi:hypothetical protein ISN75_01915 [Dyella marensis]|uniref:cytochrome c oxidase assembly factor Coa1 family protein n=1 Tax=Dyella marensis TaxID=500610 RepID=UPI0031CFA1E6